VTSLLTVRPGLAVEATSRPVAHQPVVRAGSAPWSLRDLTQVTRTLMVSGTGLLVAWLVASGTTSLEKQEYAVAGAIVATTLAVTGLAGWLLAGVRCLRAERACSLPMVRGLVARRTPAEPGPAAMNGPVTVSGMRHHHRQDCLMVKGKAVYAVGGGHLLPCPICLSTVTP
jgi:hypothetical protein